MGEREAESRVFVFRRIKFLIFYRGLEWTQVLNILDKCSATDLCSQAQEVSFLKVFSSIPLQNKWSKENSPVLPISNEDNK